MILPSFYYAGKFCVNRKMELGTFLKYIYDSITISTFFISLVVKYIKNVSLMKEAFKGLKEQLEITSKIKLINKMKN